MALKLTRIVFLAATVALSGLANAQSLSPLREYEPLVIEGRHFPTWVGLVDIAKIQDD